MTQCSNAKSQPQWNVWSEKAREVQTTQIALLITVPLLKTKKTLPTVFNDFFVKVGPNLAKCIKEPEGSSDVADYLGSYNRNTMFLNGVEEKEITEIVKNCKNKKSTGNDSIDMSIIKHVISHIVKPLTHICNISLKKWHFSRSNESSKSNPYI